jgi:hypothetical protein
MSRSRVVLCFALVAITGVALGAAVTYWVARRPAPESPTAQRPSPFLAALDPQALVGQGSAGRAKWQWVDVTGPEPTRCGTCMRNFVGHCKLGPKDGTHLFIVNDFQHQVWGAIKRAGGRVLNSNDGRYYNGRGAQTLINGRPAPSREYRYCCYRIGDTFGVAHMVGFQDGDDLTVVLAVHEQPVPPDESALPPEERDRPAASGDERPGGLRSENQELGWPEETQQGKKK